MNMSFTSRLLGLKPLVLSVLIVLGVIAECNEARAQDTATMIVAGGCFWCVEADFERVQGVVSAVSGYTGGTVDNPSYREVTRGGTGHYEAVRITYDPDAVSYASLISAFFRSIDPTDSGGQFCDRGDSYRTAIFVATPEERDIAEAAKARAQRELGQTVVTPILPAAEFFPAEDYHQDYYRKDDIVLTRRGPKTKAEAYKFYRTGCGRDARVRELWGDRAVFAPKS